LEYTETESELSCSLLQAGSNDGWVSWLAASKFPSASPFHPRNTVGLIRVSSSLNDKAIFLTYQM